VLSVAWVFIVVMRRQANFDLMEARERQARIRKAVMMAEEEQRRRIKEDTRRRTLGLQEELEHRMLAQSASVAAMVHQFARARSARPAPLSLNTLFQHCARAHSFVCMFVC
jgi:hypothetical protein